jgi:hypothetical protein
MSVTTLTAKELRKAADIKERIDALQNELNRLLGSSEAEAAAAVAKGPKQRNMSAAGRARIAAAAKARWAAFRKGKGKTRAEKSAVKKKSKFSPAAKARLSAMAKERWAKAKAEGKAKL